ncbi:MAG: hypothetical protein IPG45_30375 [Deltaproteobacteria bacterium]|nr:hypothetical protein [Deltaproteobacteria bacterium]
MNRLIRGAFWAYAAATCAGCDDNFLPYNQVEGTRILGISAEPAELIPGESAQLSALVTGATSYRWSWCPVTLGPATGHACALEEHSISTASVAVITLPNDLRGLCEAAASVAAPQDGLRLNCEDERPSIAIRLVVEADDGPVSALWPLVLGENGRAPNLNPTLTAVWAEGAPLQDGDVVSPGKVLPLLAVASPTVAEDAESLKVTWFVTGGEVDRARTAYAPGGDLDAMGANTWTLPESGEDAALHLVIRDDRGGVSWLSRQVRLEGGAQ